MDQSGHNFQMKNVLNHEIAPKAINTTANAVHKGRLDCNNINNETYGQKLHQERTSKDVELVQDSNWKLGFLPHLELSLKRYEGPFSEKQACDKSSAWNHSSLSAFSLYNSRTATPTLLQQKSPGSESNGLNSVDPPKHQGLRINVEEINSPSHGSTVQDGRAVQCTPIRVIPLSLPIGDGSLSSGHSTVMQQMFYLQTGQPFWNPSSASIWQEAAKQTHSSHQPQPDQENLNVADGRSSSYSSGGKNSKTMVLNEHRHVASAAGESVGSSTFNNSRNHLNGSECGSVLSGTNVLWPMTVSRNDDGAKPADCHCLTQREMALNKFRLKRKESCLDKKVRYQSRKLLAERPRVKGQFVRQEKLNPQPRLAGEIQSDSAAG